MRWFRKGQANAAPSTPLPGSLSLKSAMMLQDLGLSLEECGLVDADFDRIHYLRQYPDVAREGLEPLEHYLAFGSREGRSPTPWFDPTAYMLVNPDVAGSGMEPFVHYVLAGRNEGRQIGVTSVPPLPRMGREAIETAGQSKTQVSCQPEPSHQPARPSLPDFMLTLDGLDLQRVAQELEVPSARGKPQVSIVIPVHNQPTLLLECLASLANSKNDSFHVVIVDDDSGLATKEVLASLRDVEVLTLEENVGFPRACNTGVAHARGDYVLLLNSDVQLAPDCLGELLDAAMRHSTTHAVFGPTLLNVDGTLQECGASVMPGGVPGLNGYSKVIEEHPAATSEATVDYVSGAVLLVETSVLESVGGLDESYKGGFYEDSALCLAVGERAGKRTLFVPKARAVHHMSATMNEIGAATKHLRSRQNRTHFVEEWAPKAFRRPVRNVAFYLPQFHRTIQNDEWWGEGYTEWVAVSRAKPVYEGQHQPRSPGVLGNYDLTQIATIDAQWALAQRYCIDAFCLYYYSFDGQNPLGAPLEVIRSNAQVDLSYCLCWANEPWTRNWDGGAREVLLPQDMSDAEVRLAAEGMVEHLLDPRYLRVDGRPLVLVYRPLLAGNPTRMAQIFRNVFRKNGLGDVVLAAVESFELATESQDPRDIGFDVSIGFPPHGLGFPLSTDTPNVLPGKAPKLYDYSRMAEASAAIRRNWIRYPGVAPQWDNTPRQPTAPTTFVGAAPELFAQWLHSAQRNVVASNPPQHRLVFINAWNEWGEGAYLEPDDCWGRGYLEAVRFVSEGWLGDFDV